MAGKTYRCSECGVEFETRDKLDEHGRRDHPGAQKRDMTGTERGDKVGEPGRGGSMGESERGGQWGPQGGERGQTGKRTGQQNPGRSGPGQSATPDDL